MEIYAGIWLDHRKAIIYTIQGDTETRHIIQSGAYTRPRIPGEGKAYTRMGQAFIAPEHTHEERLKHQLSKYYDEIMAYVQNATDILIIGPGEAKAELKKALSNSPGKLPDQVILVQSADRLTERQIAARVREFTAQRRTFRHPLNHPYAV